MPSRHLLLPAALAVLCLAACDVSDYHHSGGRWTHGEMAFVPEHPPSFEPLDERFARDKMRGYCRGTVIADSDGASFRVVSETEARDRNSVFRCDTYRNAQEYWSIQHLRIVRIVDADAATYISLGKGFARDKHRVYADGVPFKVRDPASFEPLEGDFAHDGERGYYALIEIPGSHGPSFESIDPRDSAYARDRANGYYGYLDHQALDTAGRPRRIVRTLQGAAPATLRVLGRDYAVDAHQVWHRGDRVVGADPTSFAVASSSEDAVDANDRSGAWSAGRRVGRSK